MCLTQTMPHTLLVKTHKHLNTERFLSCSWEPQASWVPSPSRRFSHRLLFLTCSCLVFSLCHSCTDLHTVAPRALCCCKGINSPWGQHCPSAPTPGELLLSPVLLVSTRQSDSHPWLLPAPERPGQWRHLEPPPSQAAWALPLLNAAAALLLPPIPTPTAHSTSLIPSLKLQAFPCLMYCQHLNIFL